MPLRRVHTPSWILFLAVMLWLVHSVCGGLQGKAIENSWRMAAIDLVLHLDFTPQEAATHLSIPGQPLRFVAKSIKNWIRRWEEWGHAEEFGRGGQRSQFTMAQEARIVSWIDGRDGEDRDHRDLYLDELQQFILQALGIVMSESGTWYLLRRLGYFRKKLHMIASGRSEIDRAEFIQMLMAEGYSLDQLVFMDETGTNTRDWKRQWGYALR